MPAPSPITETQQALIVAMELLRKGLGEDAIATAVNTQRTQQQYADLGQKLEEFMAGGKTAAGPGQAAGSAPPATGSGSVVGELQKVNQHLEALAHRIGEELKGKNPDEADARHAAGKSAFDTLGFGQSENGNESRVPRGLELGKGLGLSQSGAPNLRGGTGGGLAGGGLSAFSSAATQVAGKFQAIIGPSAVLAQILNSTTSGFGVLQTSVKVLAGAISPILLPATLNLSALFLGLSDTINEHQDLMDRFFLGLETGADVVSFFLDVIDSAADHVDEMAVAAQEFADWVSRQASALNSLNPFSSDEDSGSSSASSEKSGGREKTDRGLRDALQSLRQSIGPKASITGISEVGKQAQMAALNADPLEARLMREQIAALNRIEAKLPGRGRPGRVYDPESTGRGDYDRGVSGGSGGDYGEGE